VAIHGAQTPPVAGSALRLASLARSRHWQRLRSECTALRRVACGHVDMSRLADVPVRIKPSGHTLRSASTWTALRIMLGTC
jgi:hypothetical protein